MKQEDYVSYEVAKLQKEKGYNETSKSYYWNEVFYAGVFELTNNDRKGNGYCSAPSLSETAKWLREEHNIAVCPVPYKFMWDYTIFDLKDFRDECGNHKILGSRVAWSSYEEALNEGIKEALKLI